MMLSYLARKFADELTGYNNYNGERRNGTLVDELRRPEEKKQFTKQQGTTNSEMNNEFEEEPPESCCGAALISDCLRTEAKSLLNLSWGLSLNNLLSFFIPISMIFAIGHKRKNIIAAAGLGVSICNVTGIVFVLGLTSACDTLFSQAYGAKRYHRFGILLQRAFCITFIAVWPILAVWFHSDKLLLLLGQDEEVSLLTSQYLTAYIPGFLFYALYTVLVKSLVCQSITNPSAFASVTGFLVNGGCCYLFLYVLKLGVRGGAFAVTAGYFSMFLFIIIYIYLKRPYRTVWKGWSSESLIEWKEFIYLAVPSTSLILTEFLCTELAILIVGLVDSLEQAALVELSNISIAIYSISLGLSVATSVRVGNFVGGGHIESAKKTVKASLMLIATYTITVGLILIAVKDVVVYLFSSNRQLISMISKSIPLMVLSEVSDGIQSVCAGALRGLGYQKYGAIVNIIAYFFIAAPTYCVLIFYDHLGVPGVWYGLILGSVPQVVAFLIMLAKVDWDKPYRLVNGNSDDISDSDKATKKESNPKIDVAEFIRDQAIKHDKSSKSKRINDCFTKEENKSPTRSAIAIKLAFAVVSFLTFLSSAVHRIYWEI